MSMSKSSALDVEKLNELNFVHCTPHCTEADLRPAVRDAIIMAQKMCGFQFTITSALRSQEWERNHGRKGASSHCKGLAVDISTIDSHTRFKVVASLLYAGFPRLGIGKTFVHADMDETKAHPIIFHYYDPQNT